MAGLQKPTGTSRSANLSSGISLLRQPPLQPRSPERAALQTQASLRLRLSMLTSTASGRGLAAARNPSRARRHYWNRAPRQKPWSESGSPSPIRRVAIARRFSRNSRSSTTSSVGAAMPAPAFAPPCIRRDSARGSTSSTSSLPPRQPLPPKPARKRSHRSQSRCVKPPTGGQQHRGAFRQPLADQPRGNRRAGQVN